MTAEELISRLALLGAILALLAGPVHSADEASIIDTVMKERYTAGELPEHRCRLYVHAEYGRYCVQPQKSEWEWVHGRRRLYLLTAGVPVRADDVIEVLPVHALPGLVGAFVLELRDDGAPRYVAATDAMMTGSFGDAGTSAAKLTLIGPDYYAWVFVSGGTWQGISVGHWNILAPHGAGVVDVSDIPEMREEDQEHRFEIEFDATRSGLPVFPLIVTVREAPPTEGTVARRVVRFDRKTWRYEMPESVPGLAP